MIRRLLLGLLLALALPVLTLAQTAPDYAAWEKLAEHSTVVLEQAQEENTLITDEALSQLRSQVVKWRNQFEEAQSLNADQIETVKNQITALGPAPAEGATEDEAIAKRRAELNDTLAKLQAPGIAATEAASHADGVIRNIDREVRERQADKLLRLSPSAANPVNWPAAVSMFRWMGAWIYDETVWRFSRPFNWETLRNNAPLIVTLVLMAGLLLARGSYWMGRISRWLLTKTQMRGRELASALVSLGQVILPVLGAVMLAEAAGKTALFGPILMQLFRFAPVVLLTVLFANWLGRKIFSPQAEDRNAMTLSDERRAEARFHVLMLGLAMGLQQLLTTWIAPRAQDYLGGSGTIAAEKAQEVALRADTALSVLAAPLLIFAGMLLFRVGQLLRHYHAANREGDEEAAFRDKLLHLIGTAAIVIAVVSPTLGVIGYVSAANAMMWPAILTLGVFALISVLHRLIIELYALVMRRDATEPDALVPVVALMLLSLGALPVLALIWGARVEDLRELWSHFQSGFAIGGVQISPGIFMTFAVVFVLGFMLTRLVQGGLRSSVLPKTRIDKGGQNAILSGVGYIGIFLSALIAISTAGIDLSSLAIVAGALSVGIGFGLQTIVQNFVSGIILLIERPISEGDLIEVNVQMGTVRAISVRSTRIETLDRYDLIVPNGDLIAGQVTNLTRGNVMGRLVLPVGVAYGTDTRRVAEILREIAENQPTVMMNPAPQVLFVGFGADSLDFEIRVILSDVNFRVPVQTEINHQIAERFAAEGIEIPFAQRDIWIRNPEALVPGHKPVPAKPVDADEPEAATEAPMSEAAEPAAPVRLSDNDGSEEGDDQ